MDTEVVMGKFDKGQTIAAVGIDKRVLDPRVACFVAASEEELSLLDSAIALGDFIKAAQIARGLHDATDGLPLASVKDMARIIEAIAQGSQDKSAMAAMSGILRQRINDLKKPK